MKKLVFIFILVAAVASCGTSEKTPAAPQETVCADSVSRIVAQRVDSIYTEVFAAYSRGDNNCFWEDSICKYGKFERRYMTEAYYTALRKVEWVEELPEEQRCIILYDGTPWVCGQDYGNLAFHIDSVAPADSGHYHADLTVENLGHKTHVRLDLIRERGEWRIDDMLTWMEDGRVCSERRIMAQAIKEYYGE